ncbi:hypothetical protein [Aquibacillus halophilus]|nr:hypothetical protein [Aquibacillus halophilus]
MKLNNILVDMKEGDVMLSAILFGLILTGTIGLIITADVISN